MPLSTCSWMKSHTNFWWEYLCLQWPLSALVKNLQPCFPNTIQYSYQSCWRVAGLGCSLTHVSTCSSAWRKRALLQPSACTAARWSCCSGFISILWTSIFMTCCWLRIVLRMLSMALLCSVMERSNEKTPPYLIAKGLDSNSLQCRCNEGFS